MKKTLLIALASCALLNLNSNAAAAPAGAKSRAIQISALCRNQNARVMVIRELMSTTAGKLELAEMLKHDATFRSYYETNTPNAG